MAQEAKGAEEAKEAMIMPCRLETTLQCFFKLARQILDIVFKS